MGKRPRPPAQRRVGRFGDRRETRTDEALERGRFSEGIEHHPDARENRTERRFSEGYDHGKAAG